MTHFAGIDLHDATLEYIAVDWATGGCVASLRRANSAPDARVRVAWSKVTEVSVGRAQPWGPATTVLEARALPGGLDELTMQSGDVIRVRAASREVQEGASPDRPGTHTG